MGQPRYPQMNEQDGVAVVDEPVVRVGGRSPSTLSTGCAPTATAEAAPGIGPLARGQRWSVARKRAVVLRCLGGESMELLSRELGVPVYKLERWCTKAEAGLEGALKEREADTADSELAAAMRRIGELTMEVELLRAKMERVPGPLARTRRR
jgi:transposase